MNRWIVKQRKVKNTRMTFYKYRFHSIFIADRIRYKYKFNDSQTGRSILFEIEIINSGQSVFYETEWYFWIDSVTVLIKINQQWLS